jgi:hypothetical protein
MSPDLLKAYREVFLESIRDFYSGVPEEDRNLDIKREHSFFVLENATAIMDGLDLAPRFADLCQLAALFHDLGRFPQYQRYKTFRDAHSKDHGVLGALTLRRKGLLRELPAPERSLIQAAVILHNRRFVPKNIPTQAREMVRIVRDADKLDIIRIMLLDFTLEAGLNPVVTLHVKVDPTAYSPAVYAGVMAKKRGDYRELVWVNDFKLLLCGWIYDLNYLASRALFRERDLLGKLVSTLPDNEEIRAMAQQIGAYLDATP